MSKTLIDRSTVEFALEALEDACGDRCNAEYNPCWQREVAETLRAALAEPVQEPVAWYLPCPDGYDSIFRDHRTMMACTGNKWEGFQPLYTAPPQPAEPVQEAVQTITSADQERGMARPFERTSGQQTARREHD